MLLSSDVTVIGGIEWGSQLYSMTTDMQEGQSEGPEVYTMTSLLQEE